ncbi:PAS domain-containing protein [uncultured Desulfosarcina sp.]|uniref:PAS domain-containing protein n=1 Tax=uncultured Desulfosarcina sp. TaxID=218289 RepID=UPI0029C78A49|nr:PAS domain-containing protein [uncultured Desulfosarcina sp.]
MMSVSPDKPAAQGKEILRSKHILEGTPIPTFVVDATCKLTHWNRACQSLTGFGPEDLVGTDRYREVFYPERREVLADLIVKGTSDSELAARYDGKCRHSSLIRGGYEGEDFFPNFGKNGKWLFFTAAPIKDEKGRIIGAIETLQDLTALRAAEQALDTREIHYRHLFECANDAILLLKNGSISICNQKALDLFQRTRKEMVGISPLEISPAVQPDGQLSKEAVEKVIATALNSAPIVDEWRFLRKDGSYLDTEVSLTRFKVGNTLQAMAIVRDITDRKKMIDALEVRERELDEKRRYLEKVNLALKAALDHREVEKRAVEEHLLVNLKRFVFPYIDELNKCNIDADARAYANIIDTNLNEVVSHQSTNVFAKYIDFTPAEIRIADLIREGKNTKEIAESLRLAPSSVKWHRRNIRKKLGLTNNRLNLYTYLNTLAE